MVYVSLPESLLSSVNLRPPCPSRFLREADLPASSSRQSTPLPGWTPTRQASKSGQCRTQTLYFSLCFRMCLLQLLDYSRQICHEVFPRVGLYQDNPEAPLLDLAGSKKMSARFKARGR